MTASRRRVGCQTTARSESTLPGPWTKKEEPAKDGQVGRRTSTVARTTVIVGLRGKTVPVIHPEAPTQDETTQTLSRVRSTGLACPLSIGAPVGARWSGR